MKYSIRENDIILHEYESFVISQTLECGQCFRFTQIGEENYIIVAYGKILNIYCDGTDIVFKNTTEEEFNNIWYNYFDFGRNYNDIKKKISENDEILQKAVEYAPGIRILNQDRFECLISFIISQNNRIPMIKKVISNISKKYGRYIGSVDGEEYYAFPNPEELINADEAGLMECKTGFRAKYIIDAVQKVIHGEINLNADDMDTETLRKMLMTIKGVGPKVADCTMMFSFGRCETFPTDVWVKRIMSELYFNGREASVKEIHQKAEECFGDYAGYAQQYLFNYARQFKIGA
ncbi:MAG: DNA-3-methyladenine glycosylase 2 family protein [Clostridiales bacterium]|nr:DNA-3-methyladenine glycosylase 2 family protein [Clostridiales bacterium]